MTEIELVKNVFIIRLNEYETYLWNNKGSPGHSFRHEVRRGATELEGYPTGGTGFVDVLSSDGVSLSKYLG